MASEGDYLDRNQRVAQVASRLFAADIPHTNVVTETLVRITSSSETSETIAPRLAAAIRARFDESADTQLAAHPLAIWVENTLGLAREPGDRLVRARPFTLAKPSTRSPEVWRRARDMRQGSLHFFCSPRNRNRAHRKRGRDPTPFFAFKLHQFFSGAGTVFVTLEAQAYAQWNLRPSRSSRATGQAALRGAFLPHCGHEYHPVRI